MSIEKIDRNGIIILYKEQDWTSFDVVAKRRGILGTRKVGHSGTLDPMATGVLPLFMGRATKAVDMQVIKDKEYVATFKLGIKTDSGDILGTVIEEKPVDVTDEQVKSAVMSFKGEISQIPPMFSAIKVNGQPLYKLARKGITVDRNRRCVTIKEIEMLDDGNLPENEYKIRVKCTEGTYIRTLIDDIGEKLGCGGVMTSLCRTMACGYTAEQAVTISRLQKAREEGTIDSLVLSTDTVFMHLPRIDLSKELAMRTLNGAESRISKPDGDYRVYYHDRFFAVSNITDKKLKVIKLFTEKEKENLDA